MTLVQLEESHKLRFVRAPLRSHAPVHIFKWWVFSNRERMQDIFLSVLGEGVGHIGGCECGYLGTTPSTVLVGLLLVVQV